MVKEMIDLETFRNERVAQGPRRYARASSRLSSTLVWLNGDCRQDQLARHLASDPFCELKDNKKVSPQAVCVVSVLAYFGQSMNYGMSRVPKEKSLTGKAGREYEYPWWALAVGWVLALLPLTMIPIFFCINAVRIKKRDGVRATFFRQNMQNYSELFRIQPKLPSYERIRRPKIVTVHF